MSRPDGSLGEPPCLNSPRRPRTRGTVRSTTASRPRSRPRRPRRPPPRGAICRARGRELHASSTPRQRAKEDEFRRLRAAAPSALSRPLGRLRVATRRVRAAGPDSASPTTAASAAIVRPSGHDRLQQGEERESDHPAAAGRAAPASPAAPRRPAAHGCRAAPQDPHGGTASIQSPTFRSCSHRPASEHHRRTAGCRLPRPHSSTGRSPRLQPESPAPLPRRGRGAATARTRQGSGVSSVGAGSTRVPLVGRAWRAGKTTP